MNAASEIAAVAGRLRAAADLSSSSRLAADGIGRFHLSPARANLLRHLDLSGLAILELDAGCGGLSRYLGEEAASLVAVESSPEQREALAERLRGLPQARVAASLDEVLEGDGLFDLVVLVEPAGAPSAEDFDRRLAAAAARLRPGGLVALACSNRLGLGQLAGQPARGSGAYFAGLAGDEGAGRSRLEWRRSLDGLGLAVKAEYLLSPEIWLPSCVLDPELVAADAELAADLLCHLPFADPHLPAFPLLPPALLAESLARGGLLADLAPGYLWLCGRSASSALVSRLRGEAELGWHFAAERQPATATRFYSRGGELRVAKKALTPPPELRGISWSEEKDQPLLRGRRWRLQLLRAAYFEKGTFEDELAALLAELAGSFAAGEGLMRGEALDALFHNAILGGDGVTRVFDLEWRSGDDLPASWWVLRNVLALAPSLETIGHGIGSVNLAELYDKLCRRLGLVPALGTDLAREAGFQAMLGGGEAAALAPVLAALLERPLLGSPFPPRHASRLGPWGAEMQAKTAEVERLRHAFDGLVNLAGDVRFLAEAVERQQRSLESIDEALRWLAGKIVERP